METHPSPPLPDLNLLSRKGLSFLLFPRSPLPIPHLSPTSGIFPVLGSKSQFGVLNDQFYEWQVWPNGLASQKGCHIEPLGIRAVGETPHFRSMPVEGHCSFTRRHCAKNVVSTEGAVQSCMLTIHLHEQLKCCFNCSIKICAG